MSKEVKVTIETSPPNDDGSLERVTIKVPNGTKKVSIIEERSRGDEGG